MIINDLPIIMIKCLIITSIVEILISILLGIRNKKDLINILLVNIVTNPLVTSIPFFINIKYGLLQRHFSLLILEIFALIYEFIIYKKYLNNKINPFLLSLILNISSFCLGEVINLF